MDYRILEFMPDAVIVSSQDGSMLYVNAMTEKLFGYERGEMIGRPIEALVPPRFRAMHQVQRQGYSAAPHVRPMGTDLELYGLKKNGEEFPADIALAPLRVGSETLVIASVRDITERKELEEYQLRKAEEKIRERDDVLAIASHELRAPVGSMQLQVGNLRRVASGTTEELKAVRERMGTAAADLNSMRDRLEKVDHHARRLARLVENLLDLSHIHTGEFLLELEDTDLAQLTREAVDRLRDEVERSGSQLSVAAEAPVRGRWDPIRIEQVIANLLMNAARYGEGKPISVTVEGEPQEARVTVVDHGIGISPEDHERIFGRFERAAAAGGVLGLGLGLYISRQIVQAHGGSIGLQSSLGHGSTFTVELPRSPRSALKTP